ncbi:hypothetical protein [Yoonia vestfoldensis]|jgi:hypothetical protein|uniref:Uncharacterized protein n=1 Tax=Yoonia vestfoldensis TaxID=245188 RepID=A0A1Y0EDL0_9RHOB|nr:hypothetical protein [Yoonia vestfoldensis]ARU01677.1 hypothetical protein LOKVESSMR4R_02373 [Yoonia vestfoldensis]
MSRDPVNISLTEALTWLAFGERLDQQGYINATSSMKFNDERQLLLDALQRLIGKALTGSIEIYGKYCGSNGNVSPVARAVTVLELASYRAFDLTIDGLRHGNGLQWLPHEVSVWEYQPLQSSAHFQDVTVRYTSLKHHLNRGTKPLSGAARKEKLAPSEYQAWFEKLSKDQKVASEKNLIEICQRDHPDHRIIRQKIRNLKKSQGPLKRGPKTRDL